jgi:putative hemolysin
MLIELSVLLALIAVNGLFAMSEIAVISSKRPRLAHLAEQGNAGATRALELSAEPTRFLSTVQMGITAVGILSGAIGEATVALRLRHALEGLPGLASYAEPLSLALMVIGLTYVSLIIGELVPKRFALTRPELIASTVARPMQWLSAVARPLVYLLSVSTNTALRLFGVRYVKTPAVTLEELELLIQQGTDEGVLQKTEQEMVTNVLDLDERTVTEVLTPRSDIVFLNAQQPSERNRDTLARSPHSVVPLCDGGLDRVIGFVRSTDILKRSMADEPIDWTALASTPLFVPRSMTLMKLLAQFKRTHLPLALVVDEFGDVDGLVSLTDVMTAIVGDLAPEPGEEPLIVKRKDGSWLMDGMVGIDALARELGSEVVLEDARERYHTLAGLAMFALGRVPKTGDVFERDGFRFEIMDMDGNRVDRVLVSRSAGNRRHD